MATKANFGNGPHAAGIFADMTVDGPEIGTLVLIVDRAKNLPNRKSMGKQNCYCAARLGKEARKTETEMRAGQTPKWDQELRFTVHDSADYYNLKISVFSEDKRTDLVGEAWVDLKDVILPGGGKSDLWQTLSCKGKYAGELRVELTYYDSRAKPEKIEVVSVAEELREQYGTLAPKVKRRPLPVNPNIPSTTPVVIPDRAPPGRAKHGPRDLANPPRAHSLPPDTLSYPYSATSLVGHSGAQALPGHHQPLAPPGQYYEGPEETAETHPYDSEPQPHYGAPQHPDFLPQLPPSQRQRASLQHQPRHATREPHGLPQPGHPGHAPLTHAHSAPTVPPSHHNGYEYDESYQPHHVPERAQDYQYGLPRASSPRPDFQHDYEHSPADRHASPMHHPSGPPPPPMHSNSSPAVPQSSHYHTPSHGTPTSRHATAPVDGRLQYARSTSPLPAVDHEYAYQTPPSHPHQPRRSVYDEYSPSPSHRSYDNSPHALPGAAAPSYGRTPPSRSMPQHQSMADLYNTPPRPHPLSQEVPRPGHPQQAYHAPESQDRPHEDSRTYHHQSDHHAREPSSLAKPRSTSPAPPQMPSSAPSSAPASSYRPKNSYSIQFPVRAFESSDHSPLAATASRPSPSVHATPNRKSVSPRPSIGESTSTPFSPDSFDVHNPNAPDNSPAPPIVGWHGNEINPADHLPVDCWAPEPEKKNTPTKTYGLGRDRDFGPRAAQPGSGSRLSKDTVINVRIKDRTIGSDSQSSAAHVDNSGRNRLTKRAGPPAPHRNSAIDIPSRDHESFSPVPNPYDQQTTPQSARYDRQYRAPSPSGFSPAHVSASPAPPPKIPLSQAAHSPTSYHTPPSHHRHHQSASHISHAHSASGSPYEHFSSQDALSREISAIDLGPRRVGHGSASSSPVAYHAQGGAPPPHPTAFVPVRSQRDRGSYY